MLQTERINFKQERSLGDILTDTFKFIRHNYKPLGQVILKVVGPVLLLALVAFLGYYYLTMGKMRNLFDMLPTGGNSSSVFFDNYFNLSFFAGAFAFILISILFYAVFYAAINFSVLSYIENDGKIEVKEVAKNVRKTWGNFFGLMFLAGFITFIGLFFCFIPGIYLFVPMSLVFSIMAFYKMGVGESFAYSFKLIRHNWWSSFFTLFVMGIIYYLASAIFQFPATIYSLVETMTSMKDKSALDMSYLNEWPYIVLSLIGALGRFLMYVLLIISATFLFFSLDEKQNQTGAFEAIENLGKNS